MTETIRNLARGQRFTAVPEDSRTRAQLADVVFEFHSIVPPGEHWPTRHAAICKYVSAGPTSPLWARTASEYQITAYMHPETPIRRVEAEEAE